MKDAKEQARDVIAYAFGLLKPGATDLERAEIAVAAIAEAGLEITECPPVPAKLDASVNEKAPGQRRIIQCALDMWRNGLCGNRSAPESIEAALTEAGLVIEQDWQPPDQAPKDGTPMLGFGMWAGEINGIDETPTLVTIQWRGGSTDYPGFDWGVVGTDAYAAWMKPIAVRPIPNLPTFPASPPPAPARDATSPATDQET